MLEVDITDLSPNISRDGLGNPLILKPNAVIVHCTRSGKSMNPTEFQGTLNYMRTPGKTSSQLVIARDGRIARVVSDIHQAWHASEDNDNTIGIELEQGAEGDGFTEPQIASLVRAGVHYVTEFGIAAVHVGSSSESGFVGHQETAQGRRFGKSDPGRLFDWNGFIAKLSAALAPTPPAIEAKETEVKWVSLKNRPEHVPFRTYILEASADGLRSYFVPSIEQHVALDESKAAGELIEVSLETMRAFGCTPDPMSA